MADAAGKRIRRGRTERSENTDTDAHPVWPGVVGARFGPLAGDEPRQVHETVLTLLETLGLSQATPSMIKRVTAAGGRLTDDHRLLFPRALVEDTVAGARRDVVLYSRRAGRDLELSGARVHMSSGGGAPRGIRH